MKICKEQYLKLLHDNLMHLLNFSEENFEKDWHKISVSELREKIFKELEKTWKEKS